MSPPIGVRRNLIDWAPCEDLHCGGNDALPPSFFRSVRWQLKSAHCTSATAEKCFGHELEQLLFFQRNLSAESSGRC